MIKSDEPSNLPIFKPKIQRQRKQKARNNYHTYRALDRVPTRYTPWEWTKFTPEQKQDYYARHKELRKKWYNNNKAALAHKEKCKRQVARNKVKLCTTCNNTLAHAMFDVKSYSKTTGKPYLRPYCRDCRKKINKDYYHATNPNNPNKQPKRHNPFTGQFVKSVHRAATVQASLSQGATEG